MVITMTTVKQEKQRINQLLSRDAKTDGNIDEIYNEAVDRLRVVVNQAFDKYSVDGILVPANLHKKVTRSDMLLLKRQYEKLPSCESNVAERINYGCSRNGFNWSYS